MVNEFSVDLPKSFYFAGKKPTVAKSGDTVTISWKLDNDGRKFESVQWIYTYDPDVMEIISANMPQMTLGDMYNIETPGSVRANASNINGYKSDPEADFIVLTFRVTGGGSATSQMYLQTFANYEAELPTTAEPTEASATAAPSTVIPTTVPVTAEPTEAPTTAPAATVQASPEPSKALKEDAEKLGKQVISFEFPADGSWGDPKNLEFDPDTHTVNVYCYPYAVFGNTVEFLVTSWESDSSKCTYTDENDLTFSYDLNSAVISDRVNAETGKNDTVSVYRYIEENRAKGDTNSTDDLIRKLLAVPGLCRLGVNLFKWMDKHGLLPKGVIDASPFHCRMWSPETVMYTSTLSPLGTGWSGSMYCPAFTMDAAGSMIQLAKSSM